MFLLDFLGSERRKAAIAVLGALLTIITDPSITGLLPDDWGRYVTVAVVVLTALGVHQVPNKTRVTMPDIAPLPDEKPVD